MRGKKGGRRNKSKFIIDHVQGRSFKFKYQQNVHFKRNSGFLTGNIGMSFKILNMAPMFQLKYISFMT